jgi:addiction module HigA family antidote
MKPVENKMRPIHPGEILCEHMDGHNWTVRELGPASGLTDSQIFDIIQRRIGITDEIALGLARAFKTTPEYWMNLQKTYELRNAEIAAEKSSPIDEKDLETKRGPGCIDLEELRALAKDIYGHARRNGFDRSLRAELIEAAADDLEQERAAHAATIKERDRLLQVSHETKALLLTTSANLAIAVTALGQIARTSPGSKIGAEMNPQLAQHALDEIRKKAGG